MVEWCYNTKITFEHMLSNKRSYDDMSGIGFNKSMIKGKRWAREDMKERCRSKNKISSNAMNWDILQIVAQMKRSSS
jgi:Asp-tRNA(Asn)/Glu-tRNA(Gln) amidotransferase C subunit